MFFFQQSIKLSWIKICKKRKQQQIYIVVVGLKCPHEIQEFKHKALNYKLSKIHDYTEDLASNLSWWISPIWVYRFIIFNRLSSVGFDYSNKGLLIEACIYYQSLRSFTYTYLKSGSYAP